MNFYERLLISTILPILGFAVLATTYFFGKKLNRGSAYAMRAVNHKHMSAALFIAFIVYSPVSFTVFQTFMCHTLDDGVSYLRADYSLTCTTTQHTAFTAYASFMIFVFPIGIPVMYASLLAANRKDLAKRDRENIGQLEPLKGLWIAYKPSRYYFEVVECGRRISLTLAAVFVLPDSASQIAIVLLIAVVFLFISESMSPFDKGLDMALYRWGNGITLATMYVALLLRFDLANENSEATAAFTGFMVVAVIVESILLVSGRVLTA